MLSCVAKVWIFLFCIVVNNVVCVCVCIALLTFLSSSYCRLTRIIRMFIH
jgi:hypothetical protein